MVFLNGVLMQRTNDYTETGGIVTFVGTPSNGDQIDIIVTGEIIAITLPQLGLTNHTLITVDASGNLQANSFLYTPNTPSDWSGTAPTTIGSVSYTHLRAHETSHHLVCRLLLEKNFF